MKALAEGMGGSVEAASAPGRLTVFTVRLPAAPFYDGFTLGEPAADSARKESGRPLRPNQEASR